MKIFQTLYQDAEWQTPLPENHQAQLVLIFGGKNLVKKSIAKEALSAAFPVADIVACSTSGEILGASIKDESLCVTAITFAETQIRVLSANIDRFSDSKQAGAYFSSELNDINLKHVLVFSDGQKVNGSALVKGLQQKLSNEISITGGLAGDGDRFEETWLWHNDKSESGLIIACGFYGENIRISHGNFGGWDVFGPDRLITKAKDNILYELDGENALQLYKRYLGESAQQLPGSALLFPLHIHRENEDRGVVRTILNIDEDENSMIFAGDLEEGHYAQLMHANFDRLIDGAETAAKTTLTRINNHPVFLALLISCVGRRLVLDQRVEEELEAVLNVFDESVPTCGFYSYGEISPLLNNPVCTLHNQTMTITTFSEI
jgi:hypothetical protein